MEMSVGLMEGASQRGRPVSIAVPCVFGFGPPPAACGQPHYVRTNTASGSSALTMY